MPSTAAPALPEAAKECVRVAVNIRPLIESEIRLGCTNCVTVIPGEPPQVQVGSSAFAYDHVYGESAAPAEFLYNECVAPLVDGLFQGYNATVLAYGQTGSGKTYAMGTNYNGGDNCRGVIPQVVETIFTEIKRLEESTKFSVRVSFIEIFNEEVLDLLGPNAKSSSSFAKPTRTPILIRETANGGVTLQGVVEAEVRSKEEMASYLTRGSLSRTTGSTSMNSESSRSHPIFTIHMDQKKVDNTDASD